MFTNFRYYRQPLPEVLAMDVLNLNFRRKGLFDAILCDPPYGVRVTSRKQDFMTDHGVEEESKQRFQHSGSGKGIFDIG